MSIKKVLESLREDKTLHEEEEISERDAQKLLNELNRDTEILEEMSDKWRQYSRRYPDPGGDMNSLSVSIQTVNRRVTDDNLPS